MIKYTLYTEDLPTLDGIISKAFDSYTLVKQAGVWKGTREASVQIVIILDDTISPFKIMQLARDIKTANKQESVLITEEPINGMLV